MKTFKQYLREQLASRKSINFQAEYNKFNKQLFNNELPKIKLKWTRLKNAGGRVVSIGQKNKPSTWVMKSLEISDHIELTHEEFKGMLVHEMIHVYLINNKTQDLGKDHGVIFRAELSRINNMNLGFIVPEEDDITNRKVSSDIKEKALGVALVYENGKESGIQVYQAKALDSVIATYKGFPEGFLKKFSFKFVISYHRDLQKYPAKRKYSKGKFGVYPVEPEFFKELLANTVIAEI